VEFNTEFGNLPLLVPINTTESNFIFITEYQKGTNANLECGGPEQGVCDRRNGKCTCYSRLSSSNGTSGPGNIGDCAYYNSNPIT
jgi:hypothetical protein